MRENEGDLVWLDALLARSIEAAGPYLRSSFEMPAHSLSARQVAGHMTGLRQVAMATVTAKGEPRVAPIGAIFYRARFHIPTLASAARTRHLRARAATSLTYFEGIDLAVLIHGHAVLVPEGAPDFAELYDVQRTEGGQDIRTWGDDPMFICIEPEVMYTYARYPDRIAG